MELDLIVASLRRYWYVILACALLGAIPGLATLKDSPVSYESEAVLMVRPPSESRSQTWSGDPDRYVIGQLGVLKSEGLAALVAKQIGNSVTTDYVIHHVSVSQQPATDLVSIKARGADPQTAQQLANAYVDLYFVAVRGSVEESQQPDIDQLKVDLADLKTQLADVDNKIALRMAPYLPTGPATSSQQFTIPGVDQIAPDLTTAKDTLLNQYSQLLSTMTELQLSARLRVTTEIVQRATLPVTPQASSSKIFVAAGIAGGLFLGFLLSVLLARFSRLVISRQQAEDILDQPFVGEMPYARSLAASPALAMGHMPDAVNRFVDGLCVRAEASTEGGQNVVIAVGSTERWSGCTTLAIAIANRFAAAGHQVLLIDADVRKPKLTKLFASDTPGLNTLLDLPKARKRASGPQDTAANRNVELPEALAPTAVPNIHVVGLGSTESTLVLRRHSIPAILAATTALSHVVIFDGGPLLASASTVQLMQRVDAAVLALPRSRQRVSSLVSVARQLQSRSGELLVVQTNTSRRRRRRRRAPANPVVVAPDTVPNEEERAPVGAGQH
jgi:capsular polysaccharide biosynthesis protein/Mrp family chromosome partitioning ATPase